jgi:L-asparaginase
MDTPNKDVIEIIITGGTIDSEWSGQKDTVLPLEHSVLPEYFRRLKLYKELVFTELFMKDSREITANDSKKICDSVEKSICTKIIITHGTYTMPDTSRFLKSNLTRTDQTIILTGSMTPLKGFDFTDAPFSLGYALAHVQVQKPGIYLCMNGEIFTSDEVAKNLSEGRFYSIFSKKQ